MNPYEALLNLMRGGGMGMGRPSPNLPVFDGARMPGTTQQRFSMRGGRNYGFPTKPCPTCGGSGVVPDVAAMSQSLGIGSRGEE